MFSVTRLGYFWKVLEAYTLPKLAQILGNFNKKLLWLLFSAPLVKIRPLLILASGHTDWVYNKRLLDLVDQDAVAVVAPDESYSYSAVSVVALDADPTYRSKNLTDDLQAEIKFVLFYLILGKYLKMD